MASILAISQIDFSLIRDYDSLSGNLFLACSLFAGIGMVLELFGRPPRYILGFSVIATALAGYLSAEAEPHRSLSLLYIFFALQGAIGILKLRSKNTLPVQFLWLMQFIVASSCIIAQVMNAALAIALFNHLFRMYGISLAVAAGLMALCLIQLDSLRHLPAIRAYYSKRRDRQIVAQQVVLILSIGLIAGIGVAGFFAKDTMRVVRISLADSLQSNSQNFIDTVLVAANNSNKIASLVGNEGGGSLQDTLYRLLELHREEGIVSIRLSGADGFPSASAGSDLVGRVLKARLKGWDNTWLVWNNGLQLISRSPVYRRGSKIGDVEVRTSLDQLDQEFNHMPGYGRSGEIVLCSKDSGMVTCFPSRLRQDSAEISRHDFVHVLPMAYALQGRSGVAVGNDYRGKVVLAAYKPVSTLGLGMVQKVDAEELFGPAISQMYYAFALLVAASGTMSWLLYRRTHPLVQDLVFAEAYARTILNNVPEAVVTLDRQGIVRSSNFSAHRIFKEDSLKSGAIFPLFCDSMKEITRGLFDESKRIEGSARKGDGSLFPYELTIGAISFRSEQLYICVLRDLTERRQAELHLQESERYTRNLLENLQAGIVVHDKDGSVKYMNRAASQFFGFGDGLTGLHIPDLFMRFFGEDGNPIPLDALPERRVLADEAPFSNHVFGVRLPGLEQIRWGLVSAFPDFDEHGMIREVIVSFVDITERRSADEALRKSQEKMQHVVESSPAATYVVDLGEGGIPLSVSFMGPRICGMVGHEPDRWSDPLFWPSHIHPEDKERVMANQKLLFEKGELRHEYRFRHENGSWVWIYDQLILARNERGAPVEIVGTWLDISMYKQAQFGLAKMNRLYLVLSEVSSATIKARQRQELFKDIVRIVVDSGGFSMAWIGLFDEDRGDIVPMACHGRDAEIYLGRFKSRGIMSLGGPAALTILEGKRQVCQEIRTDPRADRWAAEALLHGYRSSGSFPFRLDGKVIGIINLYAGEAFYFDENIVQLLEELCDAISFSLEYLDEQEKRTKAEEQLRTLNANLEVMVSKRTIALEAANAELEAFSYSVSHDLRAPLRRIDGFGDILTKKFSNQLDDESKFYLQRMKASSSRMGELINDLLELSRITLSEVHKSEINLSRIASEVIDGFGSESRIWKIEEGITAWCDGRLMKIVLENLLGNAWKFTSLRADALIEFGTLEENGVRIMYVRDNGAGFDMQYASRLFGTFQRLHKSEEFEGTGIGLATVQRIIRKHGGRIWAEAEPGIGATFYFQL